MQKATSSMTGGLFMPESRTYCTNKIFLALRYNERKFHMIGRVSDC